MITQVKFNQYFKQVHEYLKHFIITHGRGQLATEHKSGSHTRRPNIDKVAAGDLARGSLGEVIS